MAELLSGPTDPDSQSAGPRSKQRRDDKRDPWIMSEAQLLQALASLAQLVVLRHIDPKQANVLRGIYTTLLNHARHTRGAATGVAESEELREQLRQNPDLANILAPLLSPDLIDELLRGE
jgi:hypothetical protein